MIVIEETTDHDIDIKEDEEEEPAKISLIDRSNFDEMSKEEKPEEQQKKKGFLLLVEVFLGKKIN